MTLKTLTGPSIRDALADARRLFGADVVLLQSTPAALGEAASVTVAFDADPAPRARRPAPARAAPAPPPARPDPAAEVVAQPYGYAAMRKPVQPQPEPVSVSAPAAPTPPAASAPPAEPTASAAEVAALRRQLAELEAALSEVRAAAPTPPLPRAPLVFVGPGGSGKTSVALGIGQRPELVGARRPAALVVAPEAGRAADVAPLFWAAGVPVAVVASADEVREALRTFSDADLLLVDTPPLPLAPERARAAVARLGDVLAPLSRVEVHLVVDATRAAATLTPETLAQTGLRPDRLALTRLDEAPGTADAWADGLGLPLLLVAAGPEADALAVHPRPPVAGSPAAPYDPPPAARAPLDPRPAAALLDDFAGTPAWSPLSPSTSPSPVHA